MPKGAFLAIFANLPPDLDPEMIQKLQTPHLHDHMYQSTPCQIWCCSKLCG